MTTTSATPASPDAMLGRIFDSLVSTLELYCLHVGDQLGFYRLLHQGGAATSAELAARAGTAERYTREWLEQQATAGFLTCDNPEDDASERHYVLPPDYAPLLVERESLSFAPPMAQIGLAVLRRCMSC